MLVAIAAGRPEDAAFCEPADNNSDGTTTMAPWTAGLGKGAFGRPLVLTCAALLPLAACTIPDRFADRAVDYNRSLEEAENRGLLLNILRAANDRPLYFTSFSALRGSMSAALGTGAAGTLGIDGGNATSLGVLVAPSATLVNSPSFDLSVLDSQAFARGLLTPIDNNVLDVFYQQDRDMRRLLDLAVSRIDLALSRPEQPSLYRARFWNDPFFAGAEEANPGVRDHGRREFRCVRSLLARAGLELRQGPALKPVHLTVPAAQLGDAEAIANALKAGLRFRPTHDPTPQIELLRLGGDAAFVFPEEPVLDPMTAMPSQRDMAERFAGELNRYQANALRVSLRFPPATPGGERTVLVAGRAVPITAEPGCVPLTDELAQAVAGGAAGEFVLYVRSTEGVVRYVGWWLCARYGAPVCEATATAPELPEDEILTLAPTDTGRALADVDFDGRRYRVAKGDRRSARTMAQLKQLIALHTRSEEAPATAAVTVVGAGSTSQAR
jgi:hypothetical protein